MALLAEQEPVAFGVCCPQGVLLTDVPLLQERGVALRNAEPLWPVLTGNSLAPWADVSPPLAGAARLAGLVVAAAPVSPVVREPAVWEVARSHS